jgi:hypothetical protein
LVKTKERTKEKGGWKMKILTYLLLIFLSFSVSLASYCDFDLNPKIFMPNGNFNFTKVNETYYKFTYFDNITNTSSDILLKVNCNQDKTFFIISNDTYIETKPNETVNFSFIISPVQFRNYTIKSWGLFSISETKVYLDDIYYYNISQTFPTVPAGVYYQTFEIENGLQTQYVTYKINNTLTVNPIIIKFEYPKRITYAKFYNTSLIADNLNFAYITLNNESFTLSNTTQFSWEGKFYTLNSTNKITLTVENPYQKISKDFDITVEDLQFPINNIILPAVSINQTSKILLADFSVDIPINISYSVRQEAIEVGNEIITPQLDYYISDEDGRLNPTQAKKLYLLINPKEAVRYILSVEISSKYFSNKTIRVEFLGSDRQLSPEVNFVYYEKQTKCKLVGDDLLNSKYECTFTLPYNMNPENLQSTEIQMLREGYQMKIDTLNKEIKNLTTQKLILLILIALIVIAMLIYYMKDKIMLLRGV